MEKWTAGLGLAAIGSVQPPSPPAPPQTHPPPCLYKTWVSGGGQSLGVLNQNSLRDICVSEKK